MEPVGPDYTVAGPVLVCSPGSEPRLLDAYTAEELANIVGEPVYITAPVEVPAGLVL